MELIEFIKKFLPDYEKKAKEHKEMGTIMPTRMIMFDEYYFPEALQNFADRICEKQRKNCYNQSSIVQKYDGIMQSSEVSQVSIIKARQPEIDEL